MRSLTGNTSLSLSEWATAGMQKRNRLREREVGSVKGGVNQKQRSTVREEDDAADADYEVADVIWI